MIIYRGTKYALAQPYLYGHWNSTTHDRWFSVSHVQPFELGDMIMVVEYGARNQIYVYQGQVVTIEEIPNENRVGARQTCIFYRPLRQWFPIVDEKVDKLIDEFNQERWGHG